MAQIAGTHSPLSLFLADRKQALLYLNRPQLAINRLTYYRWKIAEELDKHLLEFESSVKRTGGSLLWGSEPDESAKQIKSFVESGAKCAFIPSPISRELDLTTHFQVPSLMHFMQNNAQQYPDNLIVNPKFLISSSGHIFFCTQNKTEFEALCNAKNILFVAGIDAFVQNGTELELAKNLYSIFETGSFGYQFELLTKPGKPENRFNQVTQLLLIDHNRSMLLHHETHRIFFNLLNFNLPEVASPLFSMGEPETVNTQDSILQKLTRALYQFPQSKDFFFQYNGLNRLATFIPYHIDFYNHLISARSHFNKGIKRSIVNHLFKPDFSKSFLDKSKRMAPKKFNLFVKDKLLGKFAEGKEQVKDKTFIEQYYYNKRKI